MYIPSEFLESEVRDGFYISSVMKRALSATLEVLNEVVKICNRHDIPFYAEYGTLLGTVRHAGFIPWDDDFDISMKRDDYTKFLEYAKDELPDKYKILNVYTEHEYEAFLTRIVNEGVVCFRPEFLEKYHGFPYIAGIDIFPLDYLPRNKRDADNMKNILINIQYVADRLSTEQTEDGDFAEEIKYIEEITNTKLVRGHYLRQQLYIIMDQIMGMYTSKDADLIGHLPLWAVGGKRLYPKDYFKYTVEMDYEFFKIPVPIGYDAILVDKFSQEYMKPVRDWSTHDYPFYHVMEETVQSVLHQNFFEKYVFDKKDLLRNEVVRPDAPSEREEVVFLPFKADCWGTMESYWQKEIENPNCDVYVVPIPYYDRKPDRNIGNLYYEGDKFPEYLNPIGFDAYDFNTRHPKRVYISNPYDQYDAGTSVHPFFYTDKIKAATDEMIYIPYFTMDDFSKKDMRASSTMEFFVRVPGVTRSDKVLVQSEAIRQRYIDELSSFAGEDTRAEWEKRIQVRTEPVLVNKIIGLQAEEVPDDWWQYFLNEDGTGKNIIMYYTSVSDLVLYKDKYIDKVKKVFNEFRENKDVCILWYPHPETEKALQHESSNLKKQYNKLVSSFTGSGLGIYDNSGDSYKAVALADAYYGDRGPEMFQFVKMGKPVMMQNIDV